MSIQERLYPDATCFGCGPANPDGLHLRSYVADDGLVVATFVPWLVHDNGIGYLNGGIIATVLDCHGGAAVFDNADRRGWHPLGGSAYSYVTAGLDVRYLRPSPLSEPCELRATVVSADEDLMIVEAELHWDGKLRAAATATWRRWRPR